MLLLLVWQRPAPWPSGRAAGGVLTEVKPCFARSVAGWETHQKLLNKGDALQSFLHTFATNVTKWSICIGIVCLTVPPIFAQFFKGSIKHLYDEPKVNR